MDSVLKNGEMNEHQDTIQYGSFVPVQRAKIAEGNVWEWIHEMAAASPMQPVANLGTGFIEYNPPEFLIEAHRKALEEIEGNQYAPVSGLSVLKEAISAVWSPYYGRKLDPAAEICIHNGAQEGLLSCMMAFLHEGDEVILFEPVFELYVVQAKISGATPRYVSLRPPARASTETMSGNDWTLDMDELEKTVSPKTKAIVLNHPHNPLGKVFTATELHAIGQFCITHDLLLISDEVYERIAFGSEPFTRVATLSPAIAARTLTAISLGKLFNATGWRVGFVIGPANLVHYVESTHLILAYASSSPAQKACAVGLLEAERNGFWEDNRRDVKARVEKMKSVLDELGLSYIDPAGAYFLFVNIDRVNVPAEYTYPKIVMERGSKDWKVCYYLVNKLGVTSIPGTCFFSPEHASLGESYVRFGVCKSDEGLELAGERLRMLKPLIA